MSGWRVGLFGWVMVTAAMGQSLPEAQWPMGWVLPAELAPDRKPTKGPPKADVLVWWPEGADKIRAFFLVPNNTDLKPMNESAALRAVAARHECAIVYLRYYPTGIESEKGEPPDLTRIPALLEFLVERTGRAEFRHAPWVAFGKSSRGKFPFRLAWWFPERTIATVVYHGETPTWPVAPSARLGAETILHLNVNGETEWGGTWFHHVRPALLNYRAQTRWLPHLAVAKDIGHGDYPDAHGGPGWGQEFAGQVTCRRVWEYIALFVDKALTLRLPRDRYPTDGPLTLRTVDEATGYVVDPFAVEECFAVPQLPLPVGADGLYVVGGNEEFAVSGFACVAPARDYQPPDGVPVVPLEPGKSPRQWLLTDSLKFAMARDPMLDLGELRTLRPKPGDEVTIDGHTLRFEPIAPHYVAAEGGIALHTGLRPPNSKITLLAFTVLEVPARTTVKVAAGFTAATRLQLVLNGVPVRHKQVIELAPGRYPLLVVLRMAANWGRIEPHFVAATETDIAKAKELQAEADRHAAAPPARRALRELIRPAAEVPAAARAKMFWLADRQLADAWVRLHTREGL